MGELGRGRGSERGVDQLAGDTFASAVRYTEPAQVAAAVLRGEANTADKTSGCRASRSRDKDLSGVDGVLDVVQAVTQWRDICSAHSLRFLHVGRELGCEQLAGIGGYRRQHVDHALALALTFPRRGEAVFARCAENLSLRGALLLIGWLMANLPLMGTGSWWQGSTCPAACG